MSTDRAVAGAHPLAVAGTVVTTISGALFVAALALEVLGFHTSPYLGIVTFLLLPATFVLGLLLIPLGLWRTRRRLARGLPPAPPWPSLDLNEPAARRRVAIIFGLTVANV